MARTTATFALSPTSNSQGSFYFLNINSGRCVMHNDWTILLMPTEVIENVHPLAAAFKD